jgi:hypothetical protein
MDEAIEKQVRQIRDSISSFSWRDQAFILTEISERLKVEVHECLTIECGLTDE